MQEVSKDLNSDIKIGFKFKDATSIMYLLPVVSPLLDISIEKFS